MSSGKAAWSRRQVVPPLLPGLHFLQYDAGAGEQVGGREVVPHRVAREVERVQLVPGGVRAVVGEGLAGSGAFGEDLAVPLLYRDAVGGEHPAQVRAGEALVDQMLSLYVDGHVRVSSSDLIRFDRGKPRSKLRVEGAGARPPRPRRPSPTP
jgi:hypothetical protein